LADLKAALQLINTMKIYRKRLEVVTKINNFTEYDYIHWMYHSGQSQIRCEERPKEFGFYKFPASLLKPQVHRSSFRHIGD
jgi:hypothetical protein